MFWLALDDDTPGTGLSPVVTARRVSDGVVLTAPTVVAVGSGFYRFAFTAPTSDSYVFLVDAATLTGTHRYVPMEIPAGGYLDLIDVATSTRATQASVTALGAPAQATDMATLLGRLTATRASLLDTLTLLDVAVSTRATPADVVCGTTIEPALGYVS